MKTLTPPQEEYLRRQLPFPRWLIVENTNRCNAACAICPHGEMTRPAMTMTMALFERIVAEAAPHRERIDKFVLFLHGEPLLDEQLPARIVRAKQAGISHLQLSTNASLLNETTGRQLVAAGLDELIISIDGATPAGYGASRGGLDLAAVEANAERFLARRGSVAVTVRMIEFAGNTAEAAAFRARWAGRGAAVVVEPAHNWGGARARLLPGPGPEGQFPCHNPWAGIVILADGTVPLCCLDYDAKVKLGEVSRQSILEVWRSPAYEQLRQAHLARDYRKYPLCANCSYTYGCPRPEWWFARTPAAHE